MFSSPTSRERHVSDRRKGEEAMSVGHPLKARFHGGQVYASFPFEGVEGIAESIVWDRLAILPQADRVRVFE